MNHIYWINFSHGGSVLKAEPESEIGSEIASSRTSVGLKENIEGFLCYFLTWLTGLIFFVLETKSKLVRFHAMQSFLTFTILAIVISALQTFFGTETNRFIDYFLVNLNPALLIYIFIHNPSTVIDHLFDGMLVLSLFPFFLWLFLMYKTYRRQRYILPVAGDLAEKVVGSVYNP
ncbi:hypothetical protein MSHOH_1689 [Methanosarcina horonobensis HB-1 = JCM 15518]|uniref:Uncharacterized protein n=1 Tax=Methanosarcina horonobensis HB-1 = JCM 15518 TaxID=1434110 RepID=A0A0E3SDJ9_9EURY|nr:hypothetical protein [Methanosarcina horonobensis]AKB78172.1 hypothetical protein MSHOH_1689 [Methanosarcina horonobensis HB-1 = JCM 15518]